MSIHIEFFKVRFGKMNYARSFLLRVFWLSAVHLLIVLYMMLSNLHLAAIMGGGTRWKWIRK